MGIFDFFKGNNSKLRVNANECEDVGIVTHYKGKPLTGICFRFYENTDVLEMEIEMNEGLKNGKWRSYDNEGKLKSISICKNDKIISRKYLDKDGAEIIVPNWFDGTLYENGDSIKFNNNSFRFSALELSIYDLLMGAYDIIMSLDSKSHPQYASLDLHIKNCLDWFKEANPRFYKEIIAANGNLKGAQMAHLFESNETEKSFKPQAPELIEEKKEENTSMLPDTIRDIKKLIKSNPQIKIKIEAYEEWDGFFQLSDDKPSDSIKHYPLDCRSNGEILSIVKDKNGNEQVKLNEDFIGDEFDLQKQAYEGTYFIWENGIVNNDKFLELVDEFIDEGNNPDESNIDDFISFCEENEYIRQDPESIYEFDITEVNSGCGREIGVDEFSWTFESYVEQAYTEFKIITN